jgi:hypothetical protein
MRHLGPSELVDANDSVLPPHRAVHLRDCARCREAAAALQHSIAELRAADDDGVPDPSPLFWTHFSQRVHDAIEREPGQAQVARSGRPWWWALPAAAALAAIVLLWQPRADAPGPRSSATVTVSATIEDSVDLDRDDEWALVRLAADGLEWDDAVDAGLTAGPGTTERAVLEMSSEEREALARLIAGELERSGA